jgi:hypothetical protein
MLDEEDTTFTRSFFTSAQAQSFKRSIPAIHLRITPGFIIAIEALLDTVTNSLWFDTFAASTNKKGSECKPNWLNFCSLRARSRALCFFIGVVRIS